jgi:arylsulfatase A-like enzyme
VVRRLGHPPELSALRRAQVPTFDTPFEWMKPLPSLWGGVRQRMVISWPKVIKDKGGIRRQSHQGIDIVPTLLGVTGIRAPVMVDGVAAKPIEGMSMA